MERVVALLAIIGLGLAVGRITWRGISLGSSGVIFVALIAGHFGYTIPPIVGSVGIVLFVYCLGISAGPVFIRMVFQEGKALAVMAAVMLLSAGFATWLVAKLFDLPSGLASGLFAGALTSTPGLAAITERLPNDPDAAVGFGVAYPIGVVGVIMFVQFVPRIFPKIQAAINDEEGAVADQGPIERILVIVANPTIVGKRLRDVHVLSHNNCQVSRILIDGSMRPIPPKYELSLGDRLLVVGRKTLLPDVIEVLGEVSDDVNYVLDVERQRRRAVVTSKEMIGRSLKELHLLSRFGVTISRIDRQNIEFVPNPQERIQFGDALTAVGESDALDKFVEFAGHRERTADETDIISLVVGLVLGVLVGQIQIAFNGEAISLGLAGGPLVVGLVLGHFGKIGPFVGRMPRAARFLLTEIGLAMFLAQAGSRAGGNFVSVMQEHGPALGLAASVILLVPMLVGYVVARFIFSVGVLETFGGMCGAMTSTPGLGAVTSMVDSNRPATSYATVYPLALVLITILAPILIVQLM